MCSSTITAADCFGTTYLLVRRFHSLGVLETRGARSGSRSRWCSKLVRKAQNKGDDPHSWPSSTHRLGRRAMWGSTGKMLQPTQTLGSQLVFASEEPWPPPKASHKLLWLGQIPLLFPPQGIFFHRKGAEKLRTAQELEQGSCVHDSPTSTAFTQFPGSQWGPLPSHQTVLSTNDRKWFNIHIVHPGHE